MTLQSSLFWTSLLFIFFRLPLLFLCVFFLSFPRIFGCNRKEKNPGFFGRCPFFSKTPLLSWWVSLAFFFSPKKARVEGSGSLMGRFPTLMGRFPKSLIGPFSLLRIPWKDQGWPRQTKPKKGQFMSFSQGHSGTKVRYVNRACFPKDKKKSPEVTKMGEVHEFFVLALSLVSQRTLPY